MNETIQVRKLEEGDFRALVDDLNPWNFKNTGTAYPKWLRDSDPEGISMVAIQDSRIIGYYCTLTVPLKVGNHMVPVYRGGPFVHPDHRRKRVMDLLSQAIFKAIKNRSGATYVTPKPELIGHFLKKKGCVRLKPIPRYVLALRASVLFRGLLKNTRLSKILGDAVQPFWKRVFQYQPSKRFRIREVSSFDARFDTLWQKASKLHEVISMRGAHYLDWRYLREPGHRYTVFTAENERGLLGYAIVRVPKEGAQKGLLADLLDLQDPQVTRALLAQVAAYFDAKGLERTECYLSNAYYEKIIKSMGFLKRPLRAGDVNVLFGKCEFSAAEKIFNDPKKWFVTTADLMFA